MRRSRLIITVLGVFCVPLIASGWYFIGGWSHNRADLILHTVQRDRLDLTITERGTLESAYNNDITCRVKSGQRGGGYATSIKWVIEDGTLVKEGDLLVEFDKSALEDQLASQKIVLENAKAAAQTADANHKIVVSQNNSDLQTALVQLELGGINLEKYRDGDYPAKSKDVLSRKELAEADLELSRDRTAWSERMAKKGYLSPSQVQAERSRLRSSELALQKVEEDARVLQLERVGTLKDLESKVQEAQRALERIRIQAKAREEQAMTELRAKQSVADQEQGRHDDIVGEIAKCTVKSPQDGMVVYYVAESSFFSSSRQALVAQGEPVSEGQKLMRIPDLRHMQVVAKVHEALISKVKADQSAFIRVDAYPNRVIHGRVRLVAAVASSADRYSSDVKVYQCTIALDEYLDGLRPGMSAEVTIQVGNVVENVLTVPVHAIVGSSEMGKERKAYVLTANGIEERRLEIGASNDRMAEVRSGLMEGDQVVVNPRLLLGDAAKVREPGGEKNRQSFDNGEPNPEKLTPRNGTDGKRPPGAGKSQNLKKKAPMPAE